MLVILSAKCGRSVATRENNVVTRFITGSRLGFSTVLCLLPWQTFPPQWDRRSQDFSPATPVTCFLFCVMHSVGYPFHRHGIPFLFSSPTPTRVALLPLVCGARLPDCSHWLLYTWFLMRHPRIFEFIKAEVLFRDILFEFQQTFVKGVVHIKPSKSINYPLYCMYSWGSVEPLRQSAKKRRSVPRQCSHQKS